MYYYNFSFLRIFNTYLKKKILEYIRCVKYVQLNNNFHKIIKDLKILFLISYFT